MPSDRKRGWCPTLDTPMETGDGLLVRITPPAARLTPHQARILANAARAHGNGIIELTQRGNLQIRGLRPTTLAPFADAMRAAALAYPPAHEARRPVMPPPLLGDDPAIDPRAARLTAALEHACRTDPRLAGLPGKFAIQVDGGGLLGGRPAAATLVATPEGLRPASRNDAPPLAGPLPYPGTSDMAYAFAAPFGQLDSLMLAGLATLAERHGTTLRTTPWRAILLGRVPTHEAAALTHAAGPAWIVDPHDRRLCIAACIGAPGCRSGSTPTRTDAARLATTLPTSAAIHVSGCPKGCAHPGPAPYTFVAQDGRYHLIRNGRASACDRPAFPPPSFREGPGVGSVLQDFLEPGEGVLTETCASSMPLPRTDKPTPDPSLISGRGEEPRLDTPQTHP